MAPARAACWVALLVVLSACDKVTSLELCDGPLVQIIADFATLKGLEQFGAYATFGQALQERSTLRLHAAQPADACSTLSGVPAGAAVLVERGGCDFLNKGLVVQAAGAAAMLMYNNETGCISMGYSPSDDASNVTLAAISINRETALKLLPAAQAGQASVTLVPVSIPIWDPSSILLWLMAVGTVVGGSLWAGRDFMAARRASGSGSGVAQAGDDAKAMGAEMVDVTPAAAVGFVCGASVALLLMFFFLNKAFFYLLLVLFSYMGMRGLTVLLAAAGAALLPSWQDRMVQIPWFGATPLLVAISCPPAAATAIIWAVFRNAAAAWVLQDLLGIALMLLMLRTLRLNSLRVACILLPLCFFYDVFWVFIQPMLFGGGESVMVTVARGGSTDEYVPLLLRIPRILPPYIGLYSMLGFGDVILPGLLVAYARKLDLARGRGGAGGNGGYYWLTVGGYGAGLLLTYVALVQQWGGDQGQPALLYLVPCTLGLMMVVAWARGELGVLMWGKAGGVEVWEHDSDPGDEERGALEATQEGGEGSGQVGETARLLG